MWRVSLNNLINEYLNYLFVVDDTLVMRIVKFTIWKMLKLQTILQATDKINGYK